LSPWERALYGPAGEYFALGVKYSGNIISPFHEANIIYLKSSIMPLQPASAQKARPCSMPTSGYQLLSNGKIIAFFYKIVLLVYELKINCSQER